MSRRAAEECIKVGRVSVNGVAAALGMSADTETDNILVDGRPLPTAGEKLYIMLNKPKGYVTTLHDEKDRRCVTELLSGLSPRLPLKNSDFSWLLLTRPKFGGASPQTGDALLCYIFPHRQALRNRGGSCIIFLSKFCFLPDENGKLIRLIYRG